MIMSAIKLWAPCGPKPHPPELCQWISLAQCSSPSSQKGFLGRLLDWEASRMSGLLVLTKAEEKIKVITCKNGCSSKKMLISTSTPKPCCVWTLQFPDCFKFSCLSEARPAVAHMLGIRLLFCSGDPWSGVEQTWSLGGEDRDTYGGPWGWREDCQGRHCLWSSYLYIHLLADLIHWRF